MIYNVQRYYHNELSCFILTGTLCICVHSCGLWLVIALWLFFYDLDSLCCVYIDDSCSSMILDDTMARSNLFCAPFFSHCRIIYLITLLPVSSTWLSSSSLSPWYHLSSVSHASGKLTGRSKPLTPSLPPSLPHLPLSFPPSLPLSLSLQSSVPPSNLFCRSLQEQMVIRKTFIYLVLMLVIVPPIGVARSISN